MLGLRCRCCSLLTILGLLTTASLVSARAYNGQSLQDTTDESSYSLNKAIQGIPRYRPYTPQCTEIDFALTADGRNEAAAALANSPESICRGYCREYDPSLEDCINQTWMNTICGQMETALISRTTTLGPGEAHPSRCIQLLQDLADGGSWPVGLEQRQVMAEDTVALMANGSTQVIPATNNRRTVNIAPYNRDQTFFSGLTSTWWGKQMRAFTELSKENPNDLYAARRALRRTQWNNNGVAVDSCEEYIYEKYYDYSVFEDKAAFLGSDYRAIYDLAYTPASADTPRWALGTHGLVGEPIRQKNGTPLFEQIAFPHWTQPKNTYFWAKPFEVNSQGVSRADVIARWQSEPERFPGGRPVLSDGFFIADDELHAIMVDGCANHGFVESWAWHAQQNQALSGYLDEELYAMEQLKAEYARLLKRRSDVWAMINDYWNRMQEEAEHMVPEYEVEFIWDPREIIHDDPSGWLLEQQRQYRRARLDSVHGATQEFTPFVALGDAFKTPQHSVRKGRLGPGTTTAMNSTTAMGQYGSKRLVSQEEGNPALQANYSATAFRYNECINTYHLGIGAYCELAHIEGAMEEALLLAKDLGCLDLSGPNLCDWSPKRFYQSLQDPYANVREPDFDVCNTHDQGDFSVLRGWGPFEVDHQPVSTSFHGQDDVLCTSPDWGGNPDEVERFVDCYQEWMTATVQGLRRAMSGSGTNYSYGTFGKTYGDSLEIGNDAFGASFAFGSSWSIANLLPEVSQDYCQMQPNFSGSFSATAKALYMEMTLLSADGNLQFGQGGHASASVKVLDQNVVDEYTDIAPTSFNIVEAEKSIDQELFSAGTTFVVVVVPVSIRGGAAGQVGAGVTVGGGLPAGKANCSDGDMAVVGTFKPFVSVGGFATASVNVMVAEAGVKAYLTLIRVDLPLSANLLFEGNPVNGDTKLSLNTSLDLITSILSGYISVFAEICYVISCKGYEKILFSWDGPQYTRNLYSNNVNLSVVPLLSWLEGQQ